MIALLGAMSPGPDFFLVMKNSLVYNRRAGVLTATGVGLGIFIHIFYSLVGIGVIISRSVVAFSILKYLGAAYLLYVGVKSLKAKKGQVEKYKKGSGSLSDMHALKQGFVTNVLNPKATLFFLSVFSVVIPSATSSLGTLAYGLEMLLVSFVWFIVLVFVLTNPLVKGVIGRIQHHVERVMGAVLVYLGIKIATSSNN